MNMLLPHRSGILRCVSRGLASRRDAPQAEEAPFTEEQVSKLLFILNNKPEAELKKSVGSTFFKRLMEHRREHGTFESMDDVKSIAGRAKGGLHRSVMTLLAENECSELMASSIIPVLRRERAQSITNVVAINLDPPALTYAKMDRYGTVMDWRRLTFGDKFMKLRKTKSLLHECYKFAGSLYPELPQADIFMMDLIQVMPNAISATDRQMLQGILFTMLSFGEPDKPKVVQVKPSVVARYFNLQLGSDRTSCQNVFQELIAKGDIKLPAELALQYERSNKVYREFLALSTLHCLALVQALEFC